jgi:uncharacterized protein
MTEPSPVTYLWDFFGPRAQGTAEHFEKHLREFLVKNEIANCPTGTESQGQGHVAAFCTPEGGRNELIEKALRPKRTK